MLKRKSLYLLMAATLTVGSIITTGCTSMAASTCVSQIKKVDVINKNINTDFTFMKIYGNTLKIQGLEDEDTQKIINDKIEKYLDNKLDFMIQNEKYIYDTFGKKDENYYKKEIKVETTNTYKKGNILSIVEKLHIKDSKTYMYSMENVLNIDLITGQDVSLDDLFQNFSYRDKIISYIDEEIKNNKEEYSVSSVKDIPEKDFYLENKNLIVRYDVGEIASYNKGIKEFKVPLELFEKNFNDDIHLKKAPVLIETKKITKDDKYIKSIVNIPVIKRIKSYEEGMAYREIKDNLNDKIKTDILTFSDEMYELSKNGMGSDFDRPSICNVTFEEAYNKGRLLSLYTRNYMYTGGAHGEERDIAYNVDLKTGEILSIKDLFKDNIEYKKLINDQINMDIKRIQEKTRAEYEKKGQKLDDMYLPYRSFKGINDNQNFYLKDDTLVIYFDVYEIASYASGIVKFPIKITHLGDSIKDEYIIQ